MDPKKKKEIIIGVAIVAGILILGGAASLFKWSPYKKISAVPAGGLY